MKIDPIDLLLKEQEFFLNTSLFLISGNEETLISRIYDCILYNFKKINFIEREEFEFASINQKNIIRQESSLFSSFKILVYKKPKDYDIEYLETTVNKNIKIIIIDEKIKNSSKTKKAFDLHKKFITVTCYKISRDLKKKYIDIFFLKNDINLEKDAYWFFLDNSDDRFMLFEGELTKIRNYDKKIINLNEIKILLSKNESQNIDNLFFLIISSQDKIISDTNKSLNSLGDSYLLLQKSKFYFDLYLQCKNLQDASNILPRYMFMEKERFLSVFKKLSQSKILIILNLIRVAEIALRKKSFLHLSTSQRFLLNLRRVLHR